MLEPEVVVQMAGEVLLDAEEALAPFAGATVPAGSGVFLKSRLRLYSSRAMAFVAAIADASLTADGAN